MQRVLIWIVVLTVSILPVFAQAADDVKSGAEEQEEQNIYLNGTKIPLKTALELVLRNNLTLKKARYDVIMSDSSLRKSRKQYAPILELETKYLKQKQPVSGSTVFSGDEYSEISISGGISKRFGTGTTVSTGVTQSRSDSNDAAIPGVKEEYPAYYEPSLYVTLQQELLRNSFGINERREEEVLRINAKIQREALIDELSGLVIQALIDYWQVTIEKKALENAQKELDSASYVRSIIARNVRLGISENYELNQYNSIVASAESKVAQREQALREAIRTLLRTVNMPPETQVSGVTDLVDTLPELDSQVALDAAFKKRVDYQNAKRSLEAAELQVNISENNALPSLEASVSVESNGQDETLTGANADIPPLNYPTVQAQLKMSYPLWDEEIKTSRRDARLSVKQRKIELEDLSQEVRDEVLNQLESVQLTHKILMKNRRMRQESEVYYNRVMRRSRQGRLNATVVKNALDSMNTSRQQELESLIQYNIALLRFDLAKNEVFERYEIDVEKLIAEVEE